MAYPDFDYEEEDQQPEGETPDYLYAGYPTEAQGEGGADFDSILQEETKREQNFGGYPAEEQQATDYGAIYRRLRAAALKERWHRRSAALREVNQIGKRLLEQEAQDRRARAVAHERARGIAAEAQARAYQRALLRQAQQQSHLDALEGRRIQAENESRRRAEATAREQSLRTDLIERERIAAGRAASSGNPIDQIKAEYLQAHPEEVQRVLFGPREPTERAPNFGELIDLEDEIRKVRETRAAVPSTGHLWWKQPGDTSALDAELQRLEAMRPSRGAGGPGGFGAAPPRAVLRQDQGVPQTDEEGFPVAQEDPKIARLAAGYRLAIQRGGDRETLRQEFIDQYGVDPEAYGP